MQIRTETLQIMPTTIPVWAKFEDEDDNNKIKYARIHAWAIIEHTNVIDGKIDNSSRSTETVGMIISEDNGIEPICNVSNFKGYTEVHPNPKDLWEV